MASQQTPTQDERQPLLTKPTDVENQDGSGSSDEDTVYVYDKQQIMWYTGLIVSGFVAVVFIIRGLIRSGDTDFDLGGALMKALGGGLSGAAAMILQVLSLMPLRTIMNYQYRYGTSFTNATKTLYADGGWGRYYQGLTAALFQGPISDSYMRTLPELGKTVFASLAAACFRMLLTPIDTIKTTLQTQGKPGIKILVGRIRKYGIGTMWYGAIATAAATFVGHYPWFGMYNFLTAHLPEAHTVMQKLGRQAFIGFCASVTSDTVSNSLRVVKTYRQVNATRISYIDAARAVIASDGVKGLFGRGLKTRILANGLQGLMFSILWKFFMDLWNKS
ncbi:hypothetical protein D9756_009082 [Leucocoprinus leucothites]|uniref:Mitochondrial carrier n=1 Tax=Leucocoprinus leucothites TaxID=201217 RepID=A0A8H5CXR9_9AGAR|nr:hypothetical protein D9756_009082 [Leucoagaricus leucothites]